MPAPQRAADGAGSLSQRGQEAIARGGREQLKIEERKKIDGVKLAVPGRGRGNTRADGQVGLEQLWNLDRSRRLRRRRKKRHKSILPAGRRLCVRVLQLHGAGVFRSRRRFELGRDPETVELAVHLPAFGRVIGV